MIFQTTIALDRAWLDTSGETIREPSTNIITILHWIRKLCLKTNTFDAQFEGCNPKTDGDELSLTLNNMLRESGMQTTWFDNISSKLNAKLCHVE